MPPTELVRVYTWQPEPILNILDRDGVYYPDPNKLAFNDIPEVIDGYKWLMKFMAKDIENFSGNFPVWGWILKPSLRKKILKQYNSRLKDILITTLIPRGRILFTDFDEWHMAMNDCYYDETNSDINYYNDLDTDYVETTREQREKSWENIVFNGGKSKRICVQCCVDGLYKHEIVKVWRKCDR